MVSVYYAANKATINARNNANYVANKDKVNARHKAWRLINKDRMRVLQRVWKDSVNGYLRAKLHRLKTRTKGISFCDLTIDQLTALYNKQKGVCVLTGRKLCLKGKHSLDSLSIDRKDQRKGYTIRNVRLVTWQANSARNSGTDKQLVSFCRDVLEYTRRKKQ